MTTYDFTCVLEPNNTADDIEEISNGLWEAGHNDTFVSSTNNRIHIAFDRYSDSSFGDVIQETITQLKNIGLVVEYVCDDFNIITTDPR